MLAPCHSCLSRNRPATYVDRGRVLCRIPNTTCAPAPAVTRDRRDGCAAPHPDDVVRFPYAVLEIKLQDEDSVPEWVLVSDSLHAS